MKTYKRITKAVLPDPEYAARFAYNCKPTAKQKNKLCEAVLPSPKISYHFYCDCNPTEAQKERLKKAYNSQS